LWSVEAPFYRTIFIYPRIVRACGPPEMRASNPPQSANAPRLQWENRGGVR
jgi:hypothetical protein